MRTYYIVYHPDVYRTQRWEAHKRGILSTLGIYNRDNEMAGASSYYSADDCESKLRKVLEIKKTKARIVRVIKA